MRFNLNQKVPFIVIEGIDGAGTSTHSKLLASRFEKAGYAVIRTFEPTDHSIGNFIRKILKKVIADVSLNDQTMSFLFMADRASHLTNVIEPYLNNDVVVICDRYYFSTLVYQPLLYSKGDKQKFDAFLWQLLVESDVFLTPDLTIVLDLPTEQACNRIHCRDKSIEIYENVELLSNARERYVELISKFLWRINKTVEERLDICMVDSSESIEDTFEKIIIAFNGSRTAKEFGIKL